MRAVLVTTAIAILLPTAIEAQPLPSGAAVEIPAYNVDAICATDSDPRGRAYCLRLEQDSYDTLKQLWPQASDAARRYAIKGAAGAQKSRAFYQILAQYLQIAMRNEQMQRDAASTPKFIR